MKIALINTFTPFVRGGAEIAVEDLYDQLKIRGHKVTLFRIPFPDDYEVSLLETVLACKMLRFTSYDRVIAFKFPAYCVYHPQKVLWLFHQFRQVYELFGREYGIDDNKEGRALKSIITNIDNEEIGCSYLKYCIAKEVAKRLKKYNNLNATVITPPLMNSEAYYCNAAGDYIYYPSRVTPLKRQHLAIEAMRYVETDVKLVLAGICKDAEYENHLKDLINKYKLADKVLWENTWVDNSEKIKTLANALGVMYIPYKEDSCGFVTLEGFYSSKPVLSCTDSGGTAEFIKNNYNGYITEPEPRVLATVMDALFNNKELAKKIGLNAREYILQRNITWDETIRRLLA